MVSINAFKLLQICTQCNCVQILELVNNDI